MATRKTPPAKRPVSSPSKPRIYKAPKRVTRKPR